MNNCLISGCLMSHGFLILASVLISACTVGPDYRRPPATAPAAFKELNGWKQAQPRDNEIPGRWWEIFKDPYLNTLEEQVDIANQSLAQAEAQYRQAQALVQTARAAYFPTAAATATVNRFRAASGQNVAVSGVRYLFGVALSAAWEPDLWGGVRRQVESSEASAQASAATLQALRLSTQAALAQNYFQLRALDAQKKLLNDTVGTYERTLKITQNRYAAGMAAKTDVVQAETQLQSAQAQAIDIGVQRAQFEHAIALLMGKAPAELSITVSALDALPPLIPVSIPSELLERRPDVAAAERQTAAANAQIGVAKAAYFPTLSLAATNGFQTSKLSKLLTAAARYWALGPAAAAFTLFDGGARGAQMDEAIHAYDASVAAYRQAVLTSFQEVEDNLAALRILEQEMEVQNKAVASARETVRLTLNQYKAGTVSYLNVMTAQAVAFTNEKLAVELLGQRLNAAVLLVKAVGGGWHASALPTQDEAGGETKWSQFLPIPVK
ncbi:Toluene efflux pump outer membrane protein TtgC [Candidatus Methylobacter favarea]|uniref:Toluene efflux pump outer membrane protein TtgC n=1 Tax=Candidatus Methylobacter favarea TaxID=2707345 RepID=A0A8S0W9H1_9GAMM|nr:efflux transporter outer membrane subunit [Candidatus Methylobacter favarea]CAA9889956.1 Toluene efflux pump outer membrane protein TtgC [Candidatus Methylobacter favarea]